jgi:hypothetical protein
LLALLRRLFLTTLQQGRDGGTINKTTMAIRDWRRIGLIEHEQRIAIASG